MVVMSTAGLHRTPDDDVLCVSGLIDGRYSVAVSKDNEAENEKKTSLLSVHILLQVLR